MAGFVVDPEVAARTIKMVDEMMDAMGGRAEPAKRVAWKIAQKIGAYPKNIVLLAMGNPGFSKEDLPAGLVPWQGSEECRELGHYYIRNHEKTLSQRDIEDFFGRIAQRIDEILEKTRFRSPAIPAGEVDQRAALFWEGEAVLHALNPGQLVAARDFLHGTGSTESLAKSHAVTHRQFLEDCLILWDVLVHRPMNCPAPSVIAMKDWIRNLRQFVAMECPVPRGAYTSDSHQCETWKYIARPAR
ncbi:MAG: hypothetical protein M3O22_05800 [Pseudomonadota bacterium]|nr:hypothetical protein [Pseudomonadota bacterium]